ncbi:MAG: hypothetical protein ACHP8B_03465 [Terriglobales bacterium]
MKSRKQALSIAVFLSAVLLISIGLMARPAMFFSGAPSAHTSKQGSRASLPRPIAHPSNASLRAAVVANAMLLDDEAGPVQRVSGNLQRNANPNLPTVEEFTLMPPNPALNIYKTTVSVRFPELPAEKLASQIAISLGNQSVVLRRSADDPRVFSTQVDFDWQTFASEQEKRKEAAGRGRMVPIFQGRQFVRVERMQFLDPAEIQGALQSHQPIQFSPEILLSSPANVFPDHELMIVNTAVVEDVGPHGNDGRTFDACLTPNQGNPTGAWTFATLMMAIANTTDVPTAERMLQNLLGNFSNDQLTINGFPVHQRPGISGLLANWPTDNGLPSLPNAPVHLNAIVNRIDLGGMPNENAAGELRFVFGVTSSTTGRCAGGEPFNIILEYKVPSTFSASQWATRWDGLKLLNFDDSQPGFMSRLQSDITDQVVLANKCLDINQNPVSCLRQLRTNEIQLAGPPSAGLWEQREFHLGKDSQGNAQLQEATVAMTPDGNKFNTTGQPPCGQSGFPACDTAQTLASYINFNQVQIDQNKGALPIVPANWPTNGIHPFLGGSVFNIGHPVPALAFWNGPGITDPNGDASRIFFSLNTCNGCHGAETSTTFQQVVNRASGSPSSLSSFLLGCSAGHDTCTSTDGNQCSLSTENLACVENVQDPNIAFNIKTPFGDIARRVVILGGLAGSSPQSGGLLLPLIRQPIGVH